MGFATRPGPSPALAALVSAGIVERAHRVLDVGCGKGTDAVALAKWGFRDVTGIDEDARELAAARARAARAGARVTWVRGDARELPALFPKARFDVALETLFGNNLDDADLARYLEGLWRVTAPGALLLVQYRVRASARDADLPDAYGKWFDAVPLRTHIPEERQRLAARDYGHVVLAVGERRARAR